jgi:DNA-binding PadR family transcriptional regulator
MKNSDHRLGEFEELVMLAVGQLGDDATSVSIQDVLLGRADRDAALGAIYAALDRLERKRCVRSWLAEPTAERGGRRKRHYQLSARGREVLAELRRVRELMWRRMHRTGS